MACVTLPCDLVKLVTEISEHEGLQNVKIADVQTNQKGEGFLGQIFLVKLIGENTKQLNLVVKAAFKDEAVRQAAPIRISFENETHFYSQIYPTFQEFGKRCGTLFEFAPKCYRACLDEGAEHLVLDNLRFLGYEVFDKKSIFDEEHVKLMCETYGRFHGISFAYKDQFPDQYEKLCSQTQNMFAEFLKSDGFEGQLEGIGKLAATCLQPGQDDKIIEEFKKYTERTSVCSIYSRSSATDCDYSVITHGDCWSNNLMFKYEISDKGKKPVDLRLIDFQLIKSGSPVCDLSYSIYSGASKPIFDKIDDFLRIYHDSLSCTIKLLGSDPDKLFPFATLKEEWKKFSKLALIMSLLVWKMKATNQEDLKDFTDEGIANETPGELFLSMPFNKSNFSTRVLEVIRHMSAIEAL